MQGGNAHVAHTRPRPKQFESKQEKFPASRHTCLQIKSCLYDTRNLCPLYEALSYKIEKMICLFI